MKGIQRIVEIGTLCCMIVACLLAGTYARVGELQQATNKLHGKPDKFSVELHKKEKLPDDSLTQTPISGTVFLLFMSDGEQIGERYITDQEGKIQVNLPPGEYYFEEFDPDPSHTFDTDEQGGPITKYEFSVTQGSSVVLVEAYNPVMQGSLILRKLVESAGGSELTDEQKQERFSFTVTFSDGGIL